MQKSSIDRQAVHSAGATNAESLETKFCDLNPQQLLGSPFNIGLIVFFIMSPKIEPIRVKLCPYATYKSSIQSLSLENLSYAYMNSNSNFDRMAA